jgi:hypothetical protein
LILKDPTTISKTFLIEPALENLQLARIRY